MNRRLPADRSTKFIYVEAAPGIIVTPPAPRETSTIFTVGSSLRTWASFRQLLLDAGITLLVDVRSSPRSRLAHFNQAALRTKLAADGIEYAFLGRQLGGRPDNGIVDYEVMANTSDFRDGIASVLKACGETVPVLMCSEGEPLHCHRCLLVGRQLAQLGVSVVHFLKDGSRETQREIEEHLLEVTGLDADDLISTRDGRLARAYRLQNERLQGGRPLKRRRAGGPKSA